MFRRFTLLLAAIMCCTPVSAREASPLRQLITADQTRGWEAVGRLNFGPETYCTGALIADNIVLTAAHCLFDAKTGRRHDLETVEFLAGWRGGRAIATRGIRRAVAHPDFGFHAANRLSRVANDIALLELDRPIRDGRTLPYGIEKRPRKGAEVGVVSYARDRANAPSLQEACHVLARQAGVLVMSCDVDHGASGAPIFTMTGDRPEIVSVVSAKADVRGRQVALGTGLESGIAELRAQLENRETAALTVVPRPAPRPARGSAPHPVADASADVSEPAFVQGRPTVFGSGGTAGHFIKPGG